MDTFPFRTFFSAKLSQPTVSINYDLYLGILLNSGGYFV